MPNIKNIDVRISNKIDTSENWSKSEMIPMAGEVIIYSDSTPYPNRIKIGDGKQLPRNLPFFLEELEDIRVGFDGTVYETAGDAVREQGVKIEVDSYENGENILKEDAWTTLPECEVVSDKNGIFTVVHNQLCGDYLEQVQESTIHPRVGYYVNGDLDELTDEVPSEAKYLTDACVSPASDVKGSSSLYYTSDEGFYIFDQGKIPAAVLELSQPTRIGGVEISCRLREYSPVHFDIQVKDLTGEWITVRSVNGEGVFMYNSTEKYTFDPVVGTSVRVLIYSCWNHYPKILEIAIYEVKSGRILEKVTPESVSTRAYQNGGSVESIIDGDKLTSFTSLSYTEQKEINGEMRGYPIPFIFNFAENTPVSRIKICAYRPDTGTPKNVIVDALVDGEWIDIIGSPTKPSVKADGSTRPYTYETIYDSGFTDTFVHDFDKEYKVSAIRLFVTSAIGTQGLTLNDVEFFGYSNSTTNSTTNNNSIGLFYNEYSDEFVQKEKDVWYFRAKVACEKYINENHEIEMPKIILESDVAGIHKELHSCLPVSETFEEYFCTFMVPEEYSGSFTNLLVKAQYPNAESVDGKTCKFSDFVLINLTEAYGYGNEPDAETYSKASKALRMSIHTQDGVERYEFGGSAGIRQDEVNNLELITVEDIDAICGTTIQDASDSGVTF